MDGTLPTELARLLEASGAARERAWEQFLRVYSPLLLHAARHGAEGYDDGMDAYAYVLDRLRADDFRKLRTYRPDSRARFSTWLVLVARRIGVDRRREKYGRPDPDAARGDGAEQHLRRRLVDLAATALDLDTVADATTPDAELRLRQEELLAVLHDAIQELEPRDRLLLTLRFVDGLSAREIDAIQDWGGQTLVYRRIEQVKIVLRRRLARRGIDTPVP